MAREFQIIETQEQLDEVLKGRLGELNKKHSEATAELQSKLDALTNENASLSKTIEESKKKDEENAKTLGDLQGKVKAYELAELKARIARENNIPYEMASRITGEDEEAMKADAIALSKYFAKPSAPLASGEPAQAREKDPKASPERDAMREFLGKLDL